MICNVYRDMDKRPARSRSEVKDFNVEDNALIRLCNEKHHEMLHRMSIHYRGSL